MTDFKYLNIDQNTKNVGALVGDTSRGKLTAVQASEPKSDPQHPCKSLRVALRP